MKKLVEDIVLICILCIVTVVCRKIVIDKIFNLDKLGVCIVGRDVEENKL